TEASRVAELARARLGLSSATAGSGGPSTLEMGEAAADFCFPDDVWARVVYDLVVAAGRADRPRAELVAALVPIYFGRVGGFVIENRTATAEQAEERVERLAGEFELLKPYLVERWTADCPTPEGVSA
ncbi:MAG: hypothetical protein C4343_06675, partial [Chloroflexota bacterium]